MATDTTSSTEVGSYFVSNYPPFSLWTRENVPEILSALNSPPDASVPMGLYLHIPFCRKRCRFCYFRVYTDKNARQVEQYLDWITREWEMLGARPSRLAPPTRSFFEGCVQLCYLPDSLAIHE